MTRWWLLLAMVLTGCGGAADEGPTDEQNRVVVERLLEGLRDDPRVVELTGGYSTSLTSTGSIVVDVQVAGGTTVAEQEAVVDRVEAAVWRSPVDPVFVLAVRVGVAGVEPGVQRSYDSPREFEALEQVYGPRPAG